MKTKMGTKKKQNKFVLKIIQDLTKTKMKSKPEPYFTRLRPKKCLKQKQKQIHRPKQDKLKLV